ncbi:44324_t:CDS:2, partial [Gigaspora margarita]
SIPLHDSADALAKEVAMNKPQQNRLKLKNLRIDDPLRTFIIQLIANILETEWAATENMRYWTIDRKEEKKLVIKKGANGKKYDKKVQESIFSITKQEKIWARLKMIKGVISIERVQKVIDLTAKEKEAKTITQDLVNLAQSKFIEHIWKFRCELMAEWEVKEGIAKNTNENPNQTKRHQTRSHPKSKKVKKSRSHN